MEDLLHLNLSFNLLIIWEKSVGFALLILMSEIPMFIKSVNLKFFDEHIFFLYLNQFISFWQWESDSKCGTNGNSRIGIYLV